MFDYRSPALSKALTLLIILVYLAFNSAVADELSSQPQSTNNKKHYKIGVSFVNHYPHFDFSSAEDKGLSWAILEAFARDYGYTFEYVILPPVRLQSALDNRTVDFIYPDNPKWLAHKAEFDRNIYSIPITEATSASYVESFNQNLPLSEVTSVSIPFGYSAITWVEPIEKYNIKSIPVRDLEMALHALKTRTAVAADVEYNVGQHLIKSRPILGSLVVNKNLPKRAVNYHLSTKEHVLLLEQISQFSLEQKELIEMLRSTYGIKSYEQVFN
ncbi:hypothetical protein ACFO4O_11170 [Glaciecola siphonariae]|uniref:Solute-binding protein family 3/N-terminal domain-containing protein n=1 Tax=Glaciecola siphonariae TaxID=521012 RepID=A0ABV9LXM3_9ALTE